MAALVSIPVAPSRRITLNLPALDAVGLLTGVLYLVFFGFGFASFTDPDYWWHLRTGELIVDTLSVPRHDVFSFTAAGAPQLNHQWLSEVAIYLSVSGPGYAVTLGFFVATVLAAFAIMHRLLLRLGAPKSAALGLVALGMLISSSYWTVRPQLVTWLFLAVLANALIQRKTPPWLLVPLFALWANVHIGYTIGLGVVGLWFLSRVWERIGGDREGELRLAGLLVFACAAATLLNPNGPAPIFAATGYLPFAGNEVDYQGISELQSPDFSDPLHLPLLAGILVLMALTLAGRARDRFALLLAIAFTALALQTARYQPLFALMFLPAAGRAAKDIFPRPATSSPPRTTVNWALLAVAAIAVLVAIPQLPNAQVHRQAVTGGRAPYPDQSLAWLQEQQPDANVYAPHKWGGYFIHGLYPEGHVYIDGRSDMYGERIFTDYRAIINANEGWQELLESSGATAVVVEPSDRVADALGHAQGWSLVLSEDDEILYVRD
ncbi:MAG: hypothetical protein WD939_09745 [Dehalococcoidia bacterium]